MYSADWDGGAKWAAVGSTADQINTNGTSIHMIMAGALAEKLGLF